MLTDPDGKPSHTRYIVVGAFLVSMGKWVIPPLFGIATTEIDASIITQIFYAAAGTSVVKGGFEVLKKIRTNNTTVNNLAP